MFEHQFSRISLLIQSTNFIVHIPKRKDNVMAGIISFIPKSAY